MKSNDPIRDDAVSRQRNTVFPDTLNNEVRGYREGIQDNQPTSTLQSIGLLILGVFVVGFCATAAALIGTDTWYRTAGPASYKAAVISFGIFKLLIVPAAIFVPVFLLLRWRVRAALRTSNPRHRHRQ